ncbi:Na+/H+ antiporter NhaA [Mangrovactinospora gilvigrisea]|uniref:Na+/H+ antiporter NhaA n=1 Tax=Mangrovactinospora gilvigrisea TaxID=1428644 RepID=UPI0009A11437|nr:Na+/H+ antiporter NhaA [Mangrovactinospora gilvigrisea]
MTSQKPRRALSFLGRLPYSEYRHLGDALRAETVGGVLLLLGAVVALVWANSPWSDSYTRLLDVHVGIPALGLDLSLAHWAADGLLAVFFFVAGAELKRELVVGELRDPAKAALPVVAAVCGMVVPALVFALVDVLGEDGLHLKGWAVPIATDIAFALAVLAVIGTHLPSALRAFLLTMAVVDDLLAIVIIAIFYSSGVSLGYLGLAVLGLAVFWLLLRLGVRGWYLYLPLALVIWALMYKSGVHATISGVAMGMLLRCKHRPGEKTSPAERLEHLVRPWSAGVAVPLFAFFSAGVAVSGQALGQVFTQFAPLGVVAGLVVGKTVGVFGGSWLAARFTRAQLNPALKWADVLAMASLAGIGFTVSLLIAELAFPDDHEVTARLKAAVLVGSLLAAVLATVLLRLRNRRYRALYAEEERDDDHDGVPDIYADESRDDATGAG